MQNGRLGGRGLEQISARSATPACSEKHPHNLALRRHAPASGSRLSRLVTSQLVSLPPRAWASSASAANAAGSVVLQPNS